eukprot:COSAG02_NODE_3938_length_6013_cov_109.379270_4_plen_62_part_00
MNGILSENVCSPAFEELISHSSGTVRQIERLRVSENCVETHPRITNSRSVKLNKFRTYENP